MLDITNIALNGINLYAYCLNNPVNDTDSNGDMPDWLKWLLGGLAFIGAIVLTVVSGGSLAPVFIGMGVSIVGSGLIQGTITASTVYDDSPTKFDGDYVNNSTGYGGLITVRKAIERSSNVVIKYSY